MTFGIGGGPAAAGGGGVPIVRFGNAASLDPLAPGELAAIDVFPNGSAFGLLVNDDGGPADPASEAFGPNVFGFVYLDPDATAGSGFHVQNESIVGGRIVADAGAYGKIAVSSYGGSLVFGSALATEADAIAMLYANGRASFVFGLAEATEAGHDSRLAASNGDGLLIVGKAIAGGQITGFGDPDQADGAFAHGFVAGIGAEIRVRAPGAAAFGFLNANDDATHYANVVGWGAGAMAFGSIDTTGGDPGSSGNILAQGAGSLAFGCVDIAGNIVAAVDGAFAGGFTNATLPQIEAAGVGSFQWGPGRNEEDHSLAVGDRGAGVRLCAVGEPATKIQGDIWTADGNVLVRSAGSDVVIAPTLRIVEAGADLTTARPSGALYVYWVFNDDAVDAGENGENIVNSVPGDQWYVPNA